ncbi:MAG: HAMP domain-containing histidine kinase [Lachnospiraceae bacterium]|nr:HAMP domain-containing histidine kinase [Lachnospiraceae bacterium]
MRLKTRLVISFCIIIFLPIALMCGILFGFYHLHVRSAQKTYGIEESQTIFNNSVLVMNQYTRSDYDEMEELAKTEPGTLTSEAYLNQKNQELRDKRSFLIVRKGDQIIFNGDTFVQEAQGNDSKPDAKEPKDANQDTGAGFPMTDEEWNSVLPAYGYGGGETGADGGYYLSGETQSLLKQLDFVTPDGQEASAFIVTSSSSVLPEVKQLIIEIVVLVVLVLGITAVCMTVWIYQSMTRPISKLQKATQNIKEGNLDFTIESDSEDEIGELTRNFEEMRQRLKESTEERVRSEQENRVLISNIAHDLKTPITAVKGYAEGLVDGVADTPEKLNRYVQTIYNKANEMDRLINELTLYSNIDANRIPYNFDKINAKAYFDDCIEDIGIDLETQGIKLTYENNVDDDVQIIADPEQIMRVINNIISNGVKYMDKPYKLIGIRLKDVGDFVQVEIDDNGRGIALKDLPYIFDRFYRTDASRNSKTGGSGIGLSIVKKIVEDHGGRIWATSKEGVGTTMYFVLRKYVDTVL